MLVVSRSALALPLGLEGALTSESTWITSSVSAPSPPPPSTPPSSSEFVPPHITGRSRQSLKKAEVTALAVVDEERVAARSMSQGLSEILAVEIALALRRRR